MHDPKSPLRQKGEELVQSVRLFCDFVTELGELLEPPPRVEVSVRESSGEHLLVIDAEFIEDPKE